MKRLPACALVLTCAAVPLAADPLAEGKRAEVVEAVKKQVGTPYVNGGIAPGGFDCSGLVWWAFREAGYTMPRSSFDQFAQLPQVVDPKAGDLVFFQTVSPGASHVGVYVGDGKFVHAPQTGYKVDYAVFDDGYWKTRYLGARTAFAAPDGTDARADGRRLSLRTRLSARFALAGLAAGGGLAGAFAAQYGLALETPLAPSATFAPRLLLDVAAVGDGARVLVPLSARFPLLARWYLADGPTFGLVLSGGLVPFARLAGGAGALKNGGADVSFGLGCEFTTWGFDLQYEFGVFNAYDAGGRGARFARAVLGVQVRL